jgi:soluble lytic murein transglycosylase-like protein
MIGDHDGQRPTRTWTAALCFALSAGFALGVPSFAQADSAPAASQPLATIGTNAISATHDAGLVPGVPGILSSTDAARYAAIFELQDAADWKQADAQIAALQDKVLLGTVLAQRYLSPRYATSFAEANSWLAAYGDEPDARAIWAIAKRHATGKAVLNPVTAEAGMQMANKAWRLPSEPVGYNMQRPHLLDTGLASWRDKRWAEAAQDFEAAALAGSTPSWYVAEAAFWAARAHLALKQPELVDRWFELAAQQPRTFYGMLARDTLGVEPAMKFGPQPLSKGEVAQLQAVPAGRRALALVQIGSHDRAEAELKGLSATGSRDLADAVVALADLANMPSLCIALGNRTSDDSHRNDALYPLPHWQPRDGFSVDRALLFALIMEESRFNAAAHNNSGAAGLMQLMPGTAKSVAHSAGIPFTRVSDLVDPILNLSLGQEYVKELIGHEQVNGNLILLLAAYNSGPGPLAKLQERPETQADPLLFIESLPRLDTRLYVERVLTNLWIYRQRLGQKVPDLDALAANRWPTYVSMEASASQGQVQHAASR